MTAFGVSVGGHDTLIVVGEIDMLSAPALVSALQPFADSGGTVVLDMRGVSFMDSAGIRAILAVADALKGRGTLVLRDPPPLVVRLLEITGLMPAPDGVPLEVEFVRAPDGDSQAPPVG